MAYPEIQPNNMETVHAYMADVSTASSAFVRSPCKGRILKAGSVLYSAISVADAAITMEINGTAVTGGSWTIAYSGSAAGDADSANPTGAHYVNEGDVIEFISDGGSTTAAPVMFDAVIIKDV